MDVSVDILMQNPENPEGSLTWRAFGHRSIDGWLYGINTIFTPDGDFMSGPDIAYIYDDFETALSGTFYRGTLVNGTKAKIIAYR